MLNYIKNVLRKYFPFLFETKDILNRILQYYRFCKYNNRYLYFFDATPGKEEVNMDAADSNNPFTNSNIVFSSAELERFDNGYKIKEVSNCLAKYNYKGRILDVGCSHGGWTLFLRKKTSQETIGIDVYSKYIDILNNRYASEDVSFTSGNIQNIPYDNDSFNLAFANGVVQYVEDITKALKELHRVTDQYVLIARVCLFKHHDDIKVYQDGRFPVWIRNYENFLQELSRYFEILDIDISATVMYAQKISEPVLTFHFMLLKKGHI